MRISVSLIALAVLSLSACGAGPGPGEFKADFKSNSSFFTNMKAAAKGSSPHGTQQTWYSSNVQGLLSGASFTVPEGTVAIKEFDMMSDGTMDGYAVMVKKAAGYDTANNDWYYEMRMLDGTVMADPPAGKTMMCIECHVASKATDFLAATKLK